MVRDDRGLLPRSSGILALSLLLLANGRALAQDGPRRLGLESGSLDSRFVEKSVADARRDAAAKLVSSECRKVFSDFRDARGRTMSDNLAELGESPASYLDLVVLYEGDGLRRCDERGVFATTTPGSRAVYVCGRRFAERQRSSPGLTAVILIHEELHSLGLEENPPSSTEITARVVARCGI